MKDILDVKELLRWEGSARILIYLYSNERGHITKMIQEIGGSADALYKALPVLRTYGLIEEGVPKRVHKKGAKRKEYWLSSKGKEIAKGLIDLQNTLSST